MEKLCKRYLKQVEKENYKEVDRLSKLMENHEDYNSYHPHNEELDRIPDNVVIEYFCMLVRYGGVQLSSSI